MRTGSSILAAVAGLAVACCVSGNARGADETKAADARSAVRAESAGDGDSNRPAVWVPEGVPDLPATGPALCQGNFLKPEQGKAALEHTLEQCPTREAWEARAALLRRCILRGAGLDPLPRRTPLRPIVRDRREHDGYSVENVAFESIPGFYVTGNLYRPLKAKPPYAVCISTHGHGRSPRFAEGMQRRCGTLARMGAVVFSIDMFANGEGLDMLPESAHKTTTAMPMQIWNLMRTLDFLLAMEGVDPKRVGVSGESGGGTQTFLLTALDPRVAVSVPVVMVSSYFFGGCNCESGRPIHRSSEHFTTNAEIAALAAPRPMLVISDGKDWTQHVPEVEYPFLQRIYAHYGAKKNVANVHLANEGHDYGPSKRQAMYLFMARWLGLHLNAVQTKDGTIDEAKVTVEQPQAMRVFTEAHPLPADALRDVTAIETVLEDLQKE